MSEVKVAVTRDGAEPLVELSVDVSSGLNLRPAVDWLLAQIEKQPTRVFHILWEPFAEEGFTPREIGSLFSMVPPNVHLPCELQPFCKGIRGPYSMRPMGG